MLEQSTREKLYKAFNEKNAVQRYFSRKLFVFLEKLGFHVVGDHFYEPIPNTKLIQAQYSDRPRLCHHIDFKFEQAEQEAIELLEQWGNHFYNAVSRYGYDEANYYYRGLDAILLYCYIRETKPHSIIEVGQGISTKIILAALEDNYQETQIKPKFVSIDPYSRFILEDKEVVGVEVELMRIPLQKVPLSLFSDLNKSDLLFIDSSHIYKFGSDVEYLFEQIYPNIGKGVSIQIHDICSPYHYPLNWLTEEKRFWNEQYYLENLLRFNQEFEILIPVYYLLKKSKTIKQKCSTICTYKDFSLMGYSFYIKRKSEQ
ncbi:class I SAM-dependent methyltransferase [Pleurocapsa sp. FMAR1]|uniref:class I SAM-dependent methyltransferase n=1 Tax=Pleurocapsa sp. FMAR1 TaxID=3040204 RepID=UPI0029C7E82A|nr:class I SAM-dependent methyltransferase [Pleurocapsa sp. FMAR1]